MSCLGRHLRFRPTDGQKAVAQKRSRKWRVRETTIRSPGKSLSVLPSLFALVWLPLLSISLFPLIYHSLLDLPVWHGNTSGATVEGKGWETRRRGGSSAGGRGRVARSILRHTPYPPLCEIVVDASTFSGPSSCAEHSPNLNAHYGFAGGPFACQHPPPAPTPARCGASVAEASFDIPTTSWRAARGGAGRRGAARQRAGWGCPLPACLQTKPLWVQQNQLMLSWKTKALYFRTRSLCGVAGAVTVALRSPPTWFMMLAHMTSFVKHRVAAYSIDRRGRKFSR